MNDTTQELPLTEYYGKWIGQMDAKLMCLKNSRGEFLIEKVDERIIKYLNNNCLECVWRNQLLLITLIETERNKDAQSILVMLATLHPRLKDIFNVYELTTFLDFDPDIHMYEYLKGTVLSNSTNNMKKELLKYYQAALKFTNKWIYDNLSVKEQVYFSQYLLQSVSFDSSDFSFNKLAKEETQTTRKDETDAVVPHLPKIRAESNFRWNQMKRLRDAFRQQIQKVENESLSLPIEFYYDEPERIGERFHFRLWDKPSFVLNHQTEFSAIVIKQAIERKSTYSDENNAYFLEFINAESLVSDVEAEGLWFNELIEKHIIGYWRWNRPIEEHEGILNFLSLWGYESANQQTPKPFHSQHKGILTPSTFVTLHKDKAKGLLIDVEPFYVACTFGLLAIDILTTTGARINELLQINNTNDCINKKSFENRMVYSFLAIPKGRDELEEFYLSKQTMLHLQTVLRLLKEHYDDGVIPYVQYREKRKHLFPQPLPYYFQYAGKAIKKETIYCSIRFLLHGLIFETKNGKPVTIKTHLLRHAFATEAVQRQKIPIDIVAKMLHQRDLDVTEYYSAPTATQIVESVNELHDAYSSYQDIEDAYLRSPQELQKEFDDYREKVGVFNKVLGGTCVTDYVCPTKMQCLGCKAKIPEPDQENELLEVIKLSRDMAKRYKLLGLEVEVRKANEMAKQARIELKEIDLIKKYREECHYVPTIQHNPYR